MDSDSSEPGGKRGYRISLVNRCRSVRFSETRIRQGIRHVLRRCGVKSCHLEVAILGDLRMARLNEQWLGHDGPTDVIAFDLRDPPDRRAGRLVGQISVCGALARRRAARMGLKPAAELMLYIVHGLLHLLGYDDSTEKLAAEMHRRTDQLLSELGYGKVYEAGFDGSAGGRGAPTRSRRRGTRRIGETRRSKEPHRGAIGSGDTRPRGARRPSGRG